MLEHAYLALSLFVNTVNSSRTRTLLQVYLDYSDTQYALIVETLAK